MIRQRRKFYDDFESKEKKYINKVLIARKLARLAPVYNGLIYVLDSIRFRTTRALVRAGIDQKRICIVEKDFSVYKKMIGEAKKSQEIKEIFIFYGDLFDVLYVHYCKQPMSPLFPRLYSERSFPLIPGLKRPSLSLFAVVADLMQPRLSDEQLDALADVAEKTNLQHCFITLTARSPHGQTVDDRIAIMRKHRFGIYLRGLRFVYGYQRTLASRVGTNGVPQRKLGTGMITLGFSRRKVEFTRYRPRTVVLLQDGRVRVSWWGYPDPRDDTIQEPISIARIVARKEEKQRETEEKQREKEENQRETEEKQREKDDENNVLIESASNRKRTKEESDDEDEKVDAKRARRPVYRYPKSEPRES